MYIGIDLGTSGVKVILMDEAQNIIATENVSLSISRPKPLWSEQNPDDWWLATDQAMLTLQSQHDLQHVKAIGLTGQMHGAVLLDKNNQALRPAILWNDGRCYEECSELEKEVPDSRNITGNLMMPGFTAPKLKWIYKHEPDIFKKIAKVLLPKDYLRYKMTNTFATDMSDAAGTMWLDVKNRQWNDRLLQACHLSQDNMPTLYEGNEITGMLTDAIVQRWQLNKIPVVAGGGDNAAGAIGMGLYSSGEAMLSLGTSGVYFVVTDHFLSQPEAAVHSFCHALPQTWHLMSVMLSAASCLDWACNILNVESVPTLLTMIQIDKPSETPVYFLPYLSGERTPHNNPNAKGVFFNLTLEHNRADLARAVLEGISFALADCIHLIDDMGVSAKEIFLIGGGAQSAYWAQLLSDISGKTLLITEGGNVGPALGAAKLAQIACHPADAIEQILKKPSIKQRYQPNLSHHIEYKKKRERFNQLYRVLDPLFS